MSNQSMSMGKVTDNNNGTDVRQESHVQHLGPKQSPPSQDIPSMGVYTPDSTTNSVHSLHHYGQCDIDVSQLGLESPTSTSSDIASQNSVEAVRPPSVVPPPLPSHLQQFADCSVQQAQNQQSHNLHMAIQSQQHMQSMHAAQSPQHQMSLPGNNNANQQQQQQQQQAQTQSNRKLSQSSAGSNSSSHRNRSTTPKTTSASNQRNAVTPGPVVASQQQQQQRARVATPVNQLPSPNNQATMGGGVQQHPNASQQLHGSHGVLQHNQHQNLHLQQMQQFGHLAAPPMIHGHHAATSHAHHQAAAHHSMQQGNYLPVPPPHMSGQNYGGAQSPNSFNAMSSSAAMPPSVIQNRAGNGAATNNNNISHGNALSTQNPLASPHRMGPSPSSCAVASGAPSVSGASAAASTASNFYMQNNNTVGHHAPTPSPSIQQAPTPTPQQMQSANMNQMPNVPNAAAGGGAPGAGQNPMCSLSKLQQLTNGLEMTQQPCNTPPSVHMNLTPPPNHHPHATMTPPPISHLATGQQANPARTLSTPPASALQSQLNYHHKYYPGNMNVVCSGTPASPGLVSGSSSNSSRLVRNTPSAPAPSLNNMGGGIGSGLPGPPPPSGSSRTSPNMTSLGSNLMPPYGYLNGSRMTAAQQTAANYITNSAAGFINNAGQLPVQMMNMQGQYQDPRSTQQYGQYYLPSSMRR